jgi:cytochrome d ubiquinol oxidase subunit II
VREKWFSFPRIVYLSPLPLATAAAWLWVWFSLKKSDAAPFFGAASIFVLSFAGLAYSLFPYVVIDRLTIWEAAAHPSSLLFMLVGTSIVLPLIAGYTVYSYRVFRGKVGTAARYE